MRKVGSALILLLMVLGIVGPPIWLEVEGEDAAGTVVAKREEIRPNSSSRGASLGWSRSLFLDVRFTQRGGEYEQPLAIPVSVARYDAARVGEPVAVRYLNSPDMWLLTAIAGGRLEDQGPLGAFLARLAPLGEVAAVVAVCAVFVVAWRITKRQIMLAPVALAVVGLGVYVWAGEPVPQPPGPLLAADATVTKTWDRTDSGRRSRGIVQPFTIAALSFVPAGRSEPVVAVDQVDTGSVAELGPGARVRVQYSQSDPRWARIEGAERTYAWKNSAWLVGIVLFFLAVAVVGRVLWGRRRRATGKLP